MIIFKIKNDLQIVYPGSLATVYIYTLRPWIYYLPLQDVSLYASDVILLPGDPGQLERVAGVGQEEELDLGPGQRRQVDGQGRDRRDGRQVGPDQLVVGL